MPELLWLKRVAALAWLCWLTGCASMWGPRTVEVSQAQLQQWIDRQFPSDQRLLELLDVRLSAPRLTLRPEANRIVTEVEVRVGDRLFRMPHRGILVFNCGVRFEPVDNTLRLVDLRVERIEIDGAPVLLRRQLDRAGVQLAERSLSDRVIYTLRPRDIEAVQGRGYRPGDIRVTPSGLSITLLPDQPR